MQVDGQANVYPEGAYDVGAYNAATGASVASQPVQEPLAASVAPATASEPPLPQSAAAQSPPPGASTLPTTADPAQQTGTAGQQAVGQALSASSPGKLVYTLSKMREKGDAAGLEAFAVAFAKHFGIAVDDARLITNAMSKGGADAKALAEGVDALRTMPAGERTNWLGTWLPVARAASRALLSLGDDAMTRTFGASQAAAAALGELAATNVRMIDRNKKLPAGQSLTERAELARIVAEKRLMRGEGAKSLLAEANTTREDAEANESLAQGLAQKFSISVELAKQLVASMRSGSQVGQQIADALTVLDDLGVASGFAEGFFYTAKAAIAAEAAIAADPFKSVLGPTSELDVQPIGTLADYVGAMKNYAAIRHKNRVEAAKAA